MAQQTQSFQENTELLDREKNRPPLTAQYVGGSVDEETGNYIAGKQADAEQGHNLVTPTSQVQSTVTPLNLPAANSYVPQPSTPTTMLGSIQPTVTLGQGPTVPGANLIPTSTLPAAPPIQAPAPIQAYVPAHEPPASTIRAPQQAQQPQGSETVSTLATAGAGAALGFAVGGPVGAVIGGAAGLVAGIFCHAAGVKVLMQSGLYKEIQDIDLGDRVVLGGAVIGTGKVLSGNMYRYKDTVLNGGHAVFEGDRFIRVEDSPLAEKVDGSILVYPIVTENHLYATDSYVCADIVEHDQDIGAVGRLAAINANVARNALISDYAKLEFTKDASRAA